MGDLTGYNTHNVVCDNCGLDESRHNPGGGTLVRNRNGSYVCDHYSQKLLLTRKQWELKRKQIDEQQYATTNH